MNDTNLHVYYIERNLSGFRKYLEGAEPLPDAPSGLAYSRSHAGPSSGPRSWSQSHLNGISLKKPDPNSRDSFGRTVLHLVCSTSPNSPTYSRSFDFLTTLLAHPHINVNITDSESGYTALHRAMWSGNLRAARALLERADTDLSIKDAEGLTAMDLYNSSCAGTNPPDTEARGTDLYTWGSNRNCTLGLPDPADRALPERVNLLTKMQAALRRDSENPTATKGSVRRRPDSNRESDGDESETSGHSTPSRFQGDALRAKFDQVGIRQIALSKFHTAILTTESRGNLSLSGVSGNVCRLGQRGVHSQYPLVPMQDTSGGLNDMQVIRVALGTDHTLVVTSKGYLYSWGGNRFAQLGYVIDDGSEAAGTPSTTNTPASGNFSTSTSTEQAVVQPTPRRILGTLKKEDIIGCAASRLSSACWTAEKGGLWTWGTNMGHLGYDKAMTQGGVQIAPRKVTGISQGLVDVAMTDYAMACLTDSYEVVVLHHDAVIRVSFPIQRFPAGFSPYRPPSQMSSKPTISKITSSGITFGVLSSLGDVFTFSLGNPIDMDIKDGGKGFVVKPQMVWALRKRFTAVKDVALGSDGTVIICTHSGHVYVRQRQGNKWSFKRVPHLQRIIQVGANESGSFAAVRSDASPGSFDIEGPALAEDLLNLLPHMRREVEIPPSLIGGSGAPVKTVDDDDDEEEDEAVQRDIDVGGRVVSVMKSWNSTDEIHTLGTDVYFAVQGKRIPVHRFVLRNRIRTFQEILRGGVPTRLQNLVNANVDDVDPLKHEIAFPTTSFLAVLLFLQYIYSDEIVAIWDGRIQSRLQAGFGNMSYVETATVKRELAELAEAFQLDHLRAPLASTGKVAIPPTLASTWVSFFNASQTTGSEAHRQCDAVLKLADKKVYVSSLLLRARCPTFDAMFDDAEFTEHRRNEDGHGHIVIDLSNLKWSSLRLVLRWLHDGDDQEIFDYQHQDTLDDFLDFVFEVLAVANLLLLGRLVLACSRVVRRHVHTMNAAALASEASFHNAQDLKASIFFYIACNLEAMMENGLLDDMDIRILNDLTIFVRDRQAEKLPLTRSGILLDMAMEKHRDWMILQDFPEPRLRIPREIKPKSPRLSSTTAPTAFSKTKGKVKGAPVSIRASPQMPGKPFNEELDMDDLMLPDAAPAVPPLASVLPTSDILDGTGAKNSPWKSQAVEAKRVDMRSIMAQTKTAQAPVSKAVPVRSISSITPTRQVGFSPAESPVGSYSAKTPLDRPTTWRTTPTTPAQSSGAPGSTTPVRPSPSVQQSFPSLASAAIPQGKPSPNGTRPNGTPIPGRTVSGQPLENGQGSQPSRSNVIVPTRQAAAAAASRKNSEPAWTMAAPFATPPPPVVISPSNYANATVSLLEIQRRERDAQMQAENKPPPMTILQIQEQERRVEEARLEQERKVEEARQVELEFKKWWKEEQARLKVGGEPAEPNRGSKRGKKKPVPAVAAGAIKERREGGDVRKTPTPNEQSRRKGEQKKQANPPSQNIDRNQQQHHDKGKEPGGQARPRKNNNTETSSTIPPVATPNNARGPPASKQHSQRNGTTNNDRSSQPFDNRQAVPRQDRPAAGRPVVLSSAEKASFINVAAPAFVPQQAPAPPAFNPQAAVFLPPSVTGQR